LKDKRERYGNSWLALDGYHFTPQYQKAIQKDGFRLLVIDDMAHLSHYYADIILNQNIHAQELEYPCETHTIKLLGCKYVLLRREFLERGRVTRKSAYKAQRIVVTLGGADPDNVSLKAVMALKEIGDPAIETRIVAGPANPNEKSIKKALSDLPFSCHVLSDIKNISDIMHWADLAVSAAGSTCWELAYMGLPAVIITTAENQKRIGQGLEKAGAALNAGWHQDVDVSRLASILSEVINNSKSRKAMSEKGQMLVDGEGLERVLALMSFLNGEQISVGNYIRPPRKEDCLALWYLANDPTVRVNSFSPLPIPLEDHEQWFRKRLHSADTCMFVLDLSGVVAGQIRYDRIDNDCAEVDFAVAPHFRRRSLGTEMIRSTWQLGCNALNITIIRGIVFDSNESSKQCFLKAGFVVTDKRNVRDIPCTIFERKR